MENGYGRTVTFQRADLVVSSPGRLALRREVPIGGFARARIAKGMRASVRATSGDQADGAPSIAGKGDAVMDGLNFLVLASRRLLRRGSRPAIAALARRRSVGQFRAE